MTISEYCLGSDLTQNLKDSRWAENIVGVKKSDPLAPECLGGGVGEQCPAVLRK